MDELESFSALRGRSFLLDQIKRPVTQGRINHAQIFAGPRGTGKSSAAHLLVRAVNCTGSGEKPCGSCPSCIRFREGGPTGLIEIFPDGKSVKIEQIRTMIDEIMVRPENGMRCVIINDADTMTEAAQNSLLKTLEEPPEYALFILLTDSYTALLPTIRSRCTVLRFAPLEYSEVASMLEVRGIPHDKAVESAAAGAGSPGKALEIAGDSEYQRHVDTLINAFKGLKKQTDVAACCGYFTAKKSKSDALDGDTILQILENCACEMMMAQHTQGADACRLSKQLMNNGIDGAALMKSVLNCAAMLKSYVSLQSAMEILMFDITAP